MLQHRHQLHLSRIIRQILLNNSTKVNLMPVLQQILLDENWKFLRVYFCKYFAGMSFLDLHIYSMLNRLSWGFQILIRKDCEGCEVSRNRICFIPLILPDTGCPNKHGNSVTNSISSSQNILWFSIVIPTEKAVIRKIFVCYVYNLFVYVLTAYGCT